MREDILAEIYNEKQRKKLGQEVYKEITQMLAGYRNIQRLIAFALFLLWTAHLEFTPTRP